MSIGCLTGKEVKELVEHGAASCLYSTSTTPKWLGDLTCVYFFDSQGKEIAHQTMLTEGYILYSRTWGESIKAAYQEAVQFKYVIGDADQLSDNSIYRII